MQIRVTLKKREVVSCYNTLSLMKTIALQDFALTYRGE